VKRAALFVTLLVSCVAPASGPYATAPAYSGGATATSTTTYAASNETAYQQTYTGYEFDGEPQGYPEGYPAGYAAGYPDGYPSGYPAYPQQECKSAYGTTACGFGCVAAYGEVKCASNPGGACTAAYGRVTCWEPAPRGTYGGYEAAPASECKSAYGETACGYGCVAAYGTVRCAQQPGGACAAAYGEVTCSN
jgi:hypothetical protein